MNNLKKLNLVLVNVLIPVLLLTGISFSIVVQGSEYFSEGNLLQESAHVEGDFAGTLAITSPVNLGVVDFSLELEQLGESYVGSVTVSHTTHFSNTPEINAFITGATNGITPTFAIQSIPIVENVSGQLVTRTFSIEGEVINGGHTLDGIYSETIVGYSNKPLNINGIVRLSRPQASLGSNIGLPSLLLSSENSFVSINQSMDIEVAVSDGEGGFVANESVSFITDLGSISPNPVTTDSQGKAIVTFAAGSNLGTATIQAQTNQGLSNQLQIEVVPDVVIAAISDKDLLPTGGQKANVTLKITDNSGAPQSNVEVVVEGQLGTVDQTAVTTNAQGEATVVFTSGLTPGFGIVKAIYLGVSGQVAIPIEIRRVDDLQLTAANLALNTGESTALSATIKDQFGQSMSGELVTFFGTQGTVSPDNALTNGDGQATATFTAGSSFGSADIQALVGSASDSVIVEIVDPSAVIVSSVSPESGSADGGTVITISGANFVSASQVTLGGQACKNVTFISPGQLRCTTPVGSEGLVELKVVNPGNVVATMSGGFTYFPAGPVGGDVIYLPIVTK